MNLPSQKPCAVYILWSDIGQRFYIGSTENVAHHHAQHNAGGAPRAPAAVCAAQARRACVIATPWT